VNGAPVAFDDDVTTLEDTPVTVDVAANDTDPDGNLDPASANTGCATCTDPSNGSLVSSGDGTFDYTPNPDYNGSDSLVYQICDSGGLCDTATVHLTITPVNDPPLAADDTGSVTEGGTLNEPAPGVLSNDDDPESDPLAVATTPVTLPANGSLTLNADGSYTYVHDGSETASDSFVYEVCDTGTPSLCDTATVNLTIAPVNDPPLATDDTGTVAEGGTLNEPAPGVVGNDIDPEGDSLTVTTTPVTQPANGTLTLNADGSYTYIHDGSQTISDSFVYEVCDTAPLCDTAAVHLTITPVNEPPVAADDTGTVAEGGALNEPAPGVLGNDDDPESGPLTVNTLPVTLPANGSLTLNADGSYTYVHDGSETTSDSFVYEVCDTGTPSLCDTATVHLTITPVNDPPLAAADTGTVAEGGTLNEPEPGVLGNDIDPEGDPLTVTTTPVTQPANGTLTLNADGSYTYVHDGGESASDSFVYEVCDTGPDCSTATVHLTVTPVNDPPLAADDTGTVVEGGTLNEPAPGLLGNDIDPEGDPLTVTTTPVAQPANGSLTLNADGSYTYIHDGSETTSDSFVYEVCDTGAPSLCDTASVNLTIHPPAPTVVEVRVSDSPDDAEENTSGRVSLTSSDLNLVHDKDDQTVGMRFNGLTIPQGASITNAYLQFQVDETASVDPIALMIQGEDEDNAPAFARVLGNISGRVRTAAAVPWSPTPWTTVGEAGPDQQTPNIAPVVQEIVGRLGWSSGNSLVIIITGTGKRVAESYNGDQAGAPLLHVEYFAGPANDPPVASNDSATTLEDTLATINVVANDTDPDDNLDPASARTSCATCSGPSNGSLDNNGDGTFDYTPGADYNGSDGFVYEVCDTLGACDTAAVAITVDPVADPPLANDDSASTPEDTPVTIDVAANDTDPDGDLDVTTTNTTCPDCTGPSNGGLDNHGDGTFTYTPGPGFSGADSFVYEICDGGGLCDTAAVSLSVSPANDPPVANADSASTLEDTLVPIDVVANDSDPDGNLDPSSTRTTCGTCSGPSHGSLDNNGDGTFDYTPGADYNGSDGFVYEVCDTLGACDTAAVAITVNPVADPPLANDDSATTSEDTPVTIDVAANDSDPDGDLDVTSTNTGCAGCTGPSNGSLDNHGDGTFTYTPGPGFTGADSFVYGICDGGGLCDIAAVSLAVVPSGPTPFEVRVEAGSDDAEENTAGRISLNSSDLNLVRDKDDQTVGMRFNGVAIPSGATIVSAYVQFQVDETTADETDLIVQGEAHDNAPTFTRATDNISSRAKTIEAVSWAPAPWATRGEAGPDQRTPDIGPVIQEIVSREGWTSGNSLVIIITGTGKRVAESFNGDQAGAPLLHVEYHTGS
jgi:VCBS repeat-containing protein